VSQLTFYGLKSCDTCRKAQKELAAGGVAFEVRDVRADGVPREVLARWLDTVGDAVLVNRKSTTWRGLSDTEKASDALELLAANPTLIKRPVIEADGKVLVGWIAETKAALGL
jgi:Spx/MgsR family transcriptional regulator